MGASRLKLTDSAQTWHEPADVQKALEQSLKDLQMEYGNIFFCNSYCSQDTLSLMFEVVDLYLMHCTSHSLFLSMIVAVDRGVLMSLSPSCL